MAENVPGIILAGGRSRRMGGGDKCLLPVGGRPVLGHVIERLTPQAVTLVLNANGDPARFAAFGLPVVADAVPDFAGPLAGILAGMRWTRDRLPGAPAIVTVAADTPFLPRDLVARLVAASSGGRRIVIAASGGRRHPVFGAFPVDLFEALGAFVHSSASLSVADWIARHVSETVAFDVDFATGIDPFFNINRPSDLAIANAAEKARPRETPAV